MSGQTAISSGKPEAEQRLQRLLERQHQASIEQAAPGAAQRIAGLERLIEGVLGHREAFCDAIGADFGGRSRHETLFAEVYTSISALRHAARHLRSWMRPRRRSVGAMFQPARARVVYQPLGVVGIISPWNYPLLLAVSPLASALAAGNRVMLKPSEHTPRTSDLLAALIGELFSDDEVAVVTGGPEIGAAFSALPFDHLLFTGSTAVGRSVMRAASEHLTPVTLELGGKSPAIVDVDFPLARAVERIMIGKLLNAGQTCIAPDYALVPDGMVEMFIATARETTRRLYPRLGDNRDYSSIINERHHARLCACLDDARAKGARIIELNPADETPQELGTKLAPALLLDVTDKMSAMQEELFGPLLPIVPYGTIDEAIDYVRRRPRPLALYLFSERQRTVDRVLADTISGGVCVNDTMMHVAQENLPFGGVGASGMGHYHGLDGFETFSKKKPVFEQSRLNSIALMRPPYRKLADRVLGLLLR